MQYRIFGSPSAFKEYVQKTDDKIHREVEDYLPAGIRAGPLRKALRKPVLGRRYTSIDEIFTSIDGA